MHLTNFSNVIFFKSMSRFSSFFIIAPVSLVKLLIVCLLIYSSFSHPYNGLEIIHKQPASSPSVNGNHRSSCSPSTNVAGGNERIKQKFCSPSFICYNTSCVCPLGHAYHELNEDGIIASTWRHHHSLHDTSFCVPFETFTCMNDVQCQDIDLNVICHSTKKCRCRRGYDRNSTGFCSKLEHRNPTPSPVIDPFKTRLFFADRICVENRDCDGEYVYCSNGICKCWPEFHFVVAPTSKKISLTKSNNDKDYNNENINLTMNGNESGLLQGSNITADAALGHCVRKLCYSDDECQTEDNPNLVCNNTICECRYGYIMFRQSKTCIRYVVKRQSCDLTCRIIGGLFATIFMLTLIYWCCYCCYSIVKNYRNYRSNCDIVTESNGVTYARNNRLRLNSGETSFSGRLTASVSNFLRAQIVDEPPSYLQATEADEMLPDYDAALEIQRLNKCLNHDDSVSNTTHTHLTLDGTDDDCYSTIVQSCPNVSQQNMVILDNNIKSGNSPKMNY